MATLKWDGVAAIPCWSLLVGCRNFVTYDPLLVLGVARIDGVYDAKPRQESLVPQASFGVATRKLPDVPTDAPPDAMGGTVKPVEFVDADGAAISFADGTNTIAFFKRSVSGRSLRADYVCASCFCFHRLQPSGRVDSVVAVSCRASGELSSQWYR